MGYWSLMEVPDRGKGRVEVKSGARAKAKVKGNGQECPLHTSSFLPGFGTAVQITKLAAHVSGTRNRNQMMSTFPQGTYM
jgi:hypothetical protein